MGRRQPVDVIQTPNILAKGVRAKTADREEEGGEKGVWDSKSERKVCFE